MATCKVCLQELPEGYPSEGQETPFHISDGECIGALRAALARAGATHAARQEELRRQLKAAENAAAGYRQALGEVTELNFNLADGGPNARYLYDLWQGYITLHKFVEFVRDTFDGRPAPLDHYIHARSVVKLAEVGAVDARVNWARFYGEELQGALALLLSEANGPRAGDRTAFDAAEEAAHTVLQKIRDAEALQEAADG